MKICYLANSRFPSERAHMTQIVQMCNAFAGLGHEVTLLVTNRKTDIKESPEAFFGTTINFSVVRVSVPDVAGFSPKIPPVLRPYAFFFQRLAFTYQALSHIKRHQYTHLYGRDEWILWFLTRMVKTPIIWESHEARISSVSRKLLAKLKQIVVISEGLRDFYVAQGVSSDKILVAHDAVDARFFEPHISKEEARMNLVITTKKPVVMYIGEFDAWKGIHTVFEASKNQDSFEVFIIGGKEKEIEQFRNEYPQVHFLGRKPYRELPPHQQAADILVIPNTAKNALSAEYTSPLKLFAYMTSRKPIVASHIPSITNVLSSDEAFFFTPDDASSLQAVIKSVVTDRGEAERRATNAYKKSSEFTWNARAKSIMSSFNE